MTCILRKVASVESDESRWVMIFEKVDVGECATTTREIGAGRRASTYAIELSST